MKKSTIIAIAALVLSMTACMRDEDLALLKHPIRVQGNVDPTLGVPMAHGKMTLHDILGMLSSTYTGHVYDTTDIITIYFDTTLTDTISDFTNLGTKGGGRKAYVLGKDTTINYEVNISLFDGVGFDEYLINGNIEIGKLTLDINAFFKATCPDNVKDIINNSNYVSSSVDNIKLFYTKHDGTELQFDGITLAPTSLQALAQGDTVTHKGIDMHTIINSLPQKIRVQFDYHFWLTDQFFTNYTPAEWPALQDSINKLKIYYDVNAYAEFPFNVKITNLPYNFTVNFPGDSLPSLDIQQTLDSIARGLTVDLNDAKLTLVFDNSLPADLTLTAFLLDSADNAIRNDTLITRALIAAAPHGSDAAGFDVATGTTRTQVDVRMDEQRLRDLKSARKLGFKLGIASATDATSGNRATVSIRRDDYLNINAYVVVHPKANINIPVTTQGIIK